MRSTTKPPPLEHLSLDRRSPLLAHAHVEVDQKVRLEVANHGLVDLPSDSMTARSSCALADHSGVPEGLGGPAEHHILERDLPGVSGVNHGPVDPGRPHEVPVENVAIPNQSRGPRMHHHGRVEQTLIASRPVPPDPGTVLLLARRIDGASKRSRFRSSAQPRCMVGEVVLHEQPEHEPARAVLWREGLGQRLRLANPGSQSTNRERVQQRRAPPRSVVQVTVGAAPAGVHVLYTRSLLVTLVAVTKMIDEQDEVGCGVGLDRVLNVCSEHDSVRWVDAKSIGTDDHGSRPVQGMNRHGHRRSVRRQHGAVPEDDGDQPQRRLVHEYTDLAWVPRAS